MQKCVRFNRKKLRLHTASKHKVTTISHKQMHQKHVENLRSQLKDHNVDPFDDSSAICVSSGQEIDFPWFTFYTDLQS